MRRPSVVVLLVLLVVGSPGAAAADAGPWVWPLAGAQQVSRDFDPPATRYGAGHRGVDLPAAPGAAVRAAGAGRISYAGLLAGRPVLVVVHGALRTTYEPVTALLPLGAEVAAGEVVGRLEPGHLGCAAAACLHWGLRRGEDYLDPTRLVRAGPVRLLPVGPPTGAGLRVGPPAEGVPVEAGPAPPRVPSPSEAEEPALSLRASELPLGVLALVVLVVGLALVSAPRGRPRPPPTDAGGAGAAARAVSPEPPPYPTVAMVPVVDLDRARLRRQAAS